MPKIPDLFEEYERKFLQQQARFARRIRKQYEDKINDVTVGISNVKVKEGVISIADYPALQRRIDAAIKRLKPQISTLLINSIKESWNTSNEKNGLFLDVRTGKKLPPNTRRIFYDANLPALQTFIQRKEKGMNLSQRVWNLVDPFKFELEAGMMLGISEGKTAAAMATEMKKYLNEPDKLFRKVRDKDGKLKLSKAAEAYNPGRGIYRSSYKNALRMTATETNIAYRTADHERWKTLPFVTGIQVKLSNNHPKYDICDPLAGQYPKDFKFVGWHPWCRCYAVPVMASDEDYEKIEDAILFGEDPPNLKGVKSIPASAKEYLEANRDRIRGLKNVPYFIRDNKKYIKR